MGKKGQITTEAAYPYTSGRGSRGSCKSVTTVGATITGHKDVTHSESQMKAWVVKNGPLPIAVDAQQHWQTYTGGVVSNCNGKQLDHGQPAPTGRTRGLRGVGSQAHRPTGLG